MKNKKFNIIFHYPKSAEGMQELAHQKACVHAELVHQHIQNLDCPPQRKQELLNSVIVMVREQKNEK